MNIPCRICTSFDIDSEALEQQLASHIASLPEVQKVPPEIYESRLEICHACEAMRHGMCSYCGCFVFVRAIRKQMYCAHLKGKRWEAIATTEE